VQETALLYILPVQETVLLYILPLQETVLLYILPLQETALLYILPLQETALLYILQTCSAIFRNTFRPFLKPMIVRSVDNDVTHMCTVAATGHALTLSLSHLLYLYRNIPEKLYK